MQYKICLHSRTKKLGCPWWSYGPGWGFRGNGTPVTFRHSIKTMVILSICYVIFMQTFAFVSEHEHSEASLLPTSSTQHTVYYAAMISRKSKQVYVQTGRTICIIIRISHQTLSISFWHQVAGGTHHKDPEMGSFIRSPNGCHHKYHKNLDIQEFYCIYRYHP